MTEVELFGAKMCRIDIPQPDGRPEFTQYYGGCAIYCVTPCSEETARLHAEHVASPDYREPIYRPQLHPKPFTSECTDCGSVCEADSQYCESCREERAEDVISEPHPKTETSTEPPEPPEGELCEY